MMDMCVSEILLDDDELVLNFCLFFVDSMKLNCVCSFGSKLECLFHVLEIADLLWVCKFHLQVFCCLSL